MSVAENKALLLRLYEEVFNQGNIALVHDLIAPDAIEHEEVPGLTGTAPELLAQFVTMLRAAMPDLHVTAEDLLAEGDKAVGRFVMRGTHRGMLMGIPATGKPLTLAGIDIVRIEGGQMVEHWAHTDNLGLMQQLGVIPMPEQPPMP